MTSRENYLRIYHHEKPSFVPADGPFDVVFAPGELGAEGMPVGSVGNDWFGQSWTVTEAVGMETGTPTPGVHVLHDITEWKEKKVIPDKEFLDAFDWKEYCDGFTKNWDREERISYFYCPAGFFERLHHLMPFEEALCSFYDEPELVEAFLDALLEYKKYTIQKIVEYARPDVIIFFDDYGTSNGLFISEEMWLAFIAPRLKKMIDFCHELGLIFEMHSCGYIQPLIKHMVEMGIDSLQPLQALNDVRKIKEQFGDKIVIHGGITASELVGKGISHEALVRGVQECVDVCAPGGNFIVMLSECEARREEVSLAFKTALKKAGWEYR